MGGWTHGKVVRFTFSAPLPAGGSGGAATEARPHWSNSQATNFRFCPPTPDPICMHHFDASTSSFRSCQSSVGDIVTDWGTRIRPGSDFLDRSKFRRKFVGGVPRTSRYSPPKDRGFSAWETAIAPNEVFSSDIWAGTADFDMRAFGLASSHGRRPKGQFCD